MKINSDIINDLIAINEEDTKFLAFALSLLTQRGTIVSNLIKGLNLSEDRVMKYISILKEKDYLSKEDDKIFQKLPAYQKVDNSLDLKAEKILHDLNVVTGKRFKLNIKRRTRIKNLLTSKKTPEDFKKVHRYFKNEWNNPKMSKYINPETLYNSKFESRIEEVNFHEERISMNRDAYKLLYNLFGKMFDEENISENNDSGEIIPLNIEGSFTEGNTLEDEVEILEDDFSLDLIPIDLQKILNHWLDTYSKEDIALTIDVIINSWSKEENLIPHINLSKILDDKFPERVRVAKRTNERNSRPRFKTSYDTVDAWSL